MSKFKNIASKNSACTNSNEIKSKYFPTYSKREDGYFFLPCKAKHLRFYVFELVNGEKK